MGNKVTSPYALLKFSEKNFTEELYHNGKMHFRTLSYFKNQEMQNGRGDPDEGLTYRNKPDFLKGDIGGMALNIGLTPKIELRSHKNNFIWCSYGIFEKQYGLLKNKTDLDISNLTALGEYCLIILDVNEFNSRLENNFHSQFMDLMYYWAGKDIITGSMVEYISEEYLGDIGPFKKEKSYESQNEYRYVLDRVIGFQKGHDPSLYPKRVDKDEFQRILQKNNEIYLASTQEFYNLCIGNISDISVMVPAEEVNDALIMWFSEVKSISEIQKKYPI
ncbi:hypothetical protein [Methanococcus maripaludis]|uniref:DUF2971 domain-containing protein n=1 Tax=Methanococcus maripaludis TaxID=39152 RepID=A0A7J9SCG7_METMI|nr:hypothetical protein [Methanococcus maripaludis]MBB6497773.1 hypothetical protein [Methanococcus maripaludis]